VGDTEVDFPFAFELRANLEQVSGGNPSWTTGVNFARQLRESADYSEVVALYKAAGLSLRQDLRTLSRATPVSADPKAVAYLARNISFDGQLNMPVLTLHTTGDGLVVPENEQAYARVVRSAGNSRLLRQIFVARAGHCAFTPAETIAAVQVLLSYEPGAVSLEVTDDGRGFDPATVNGGYGLRGMRERLGQAGGSVEVRSAPGAGTRVRAELPA